MRIVAGKFRGRAIATPSHDGLRPTSDRVRESVFNIIAHGQGDAPQIEGARVIDLFAGTGALGLEAMSRGAAYCLFIETDARARALIRTNVEAFGLTGETRIWRREATDLGPVGNIPPFDLAFLDPPYGKGFGAQALTDLARGGWLKDGAIAILEEDARAPIALPDGYTELDRRTWGDTAVQFLRWQRPRGDTGS